MAIAIPGLVRANTLGNGSVASRGLATTGSLNQFEPGSLQYSGSSGGQQTSGGGVTTDGGVTIAGSGTSTNPLYAVANKVLLTFPITQCFPANNYLTPYSGAVVYIDDDDNVQLASAAAAASSGVFGFWPGVEPPSTIIQNTVNQLPNPASILATLPFVVDGIIEQPIEQPVATGVDSSGAVFYTPAGWSFVVDGGGGLVPGAIYYLSAATPGNITATPPSGAGDQVVIVGRALSTTQLEVLLGQPKTSVSRISVPEGGAGTAASPTADTTFATSTGGAGVCAITLANGVEDGQQTTINCNGASNAGITWTITPANFGEGASDYVALGRYGCATFVWDAANTTWWLVSTYNGTVETP